VQVTQVEAVVVANRSALAQENQPDPPSRETSACKSLSLVRGTLSSGFLASKGTQARTSW